MLKYEISAKKDIYKKSLKRSLYLREFDLRNILLFFVK